jgi:hypothetical protein
MSLIGTYSDLKSTISQFLYSRTDMAAYIPSFIELCEAEMNTVLKTREQLTTTTLTPNSDGEITLPTDYAMFRRVTALTTPRSKLEHVVTATLDETYITRSSGYPRMFAISNGIATILPITTSDIELEYYAKIPALSESAPTNWLLSKSPTTYLYGALKHAAIFLGDVERIPAFTQQYENNLSAVIRDDKNAAYGQSTIFRPTIITP